MMVRFLPVSYTVRLCLVPITYAQVLVAVRGPCPMLNVLANHHILPHDGKGITKEMAVRALHDAVNLSPGIGSVFATHGIRTNPDHTAHYFDLDHLSKHGVIEHDSSLSRNDVGLSATGDNHTFNHEIFDTVMKTYGESATTSFELASKAHIDRLLACKKEHEDAGVDMTFGIKELILSYGETALILAVLGDPKRGKIPVEYVRVFFRKCF